MDWIPDWNLIPRADFDGLCRVCCTKDVLEGAGDLDLSTPLMEMGRSLGRKALQERGCIWRIHSLIPPQVSKLGASKSSGLDSLAGVEFRNRLQASFEGLQLLLAQTNPQSPVW